MPVPARKSDDAIVIGQQIVSIKVMEMDREHAREPVCIGVIAPGADSIEREKDCQMTELSAASPTLFPGG